MEKRSLSVMLMTILVAGCSDAANDEPVEGGETETGATWLEARELTWDLTGCNFLAAVLEVPVSAVQGFVPEGFRVMSPNEFAGEGITGVDLPEDAGIGNVGVEAFQCESGSGLNGSVPGMTYASYYIGVDPPEEYRRDTPFHFVKLDVMIPDQDRRDLFLQYGIPATNGTATVTTGMGEGPVLEVDADLSFLAAEEFTFTGTAAAPFPTPCGFVEYTPTPNGFVEWSVECSFRQGGLGSLTVDVPPGSWLAGIMGAGPHDGSGFIGIIDFEGTVKLPAGNATMPA